MPIIASDKGGSDFEPVPAGTHHAVCYGVVDLGTQISNNPQFADSRKVCILWELPHERALFSDKADQSKKVEKPRAISNIYTLSLGTKANLRKVLESWRGKTFTEDEVKGFDVSKLIGANCFLSVIHKAGTGKNAGKTYANVSAVSALPKGTNKLPQENQVLYFSLADFEDKSEITFPPNLPDWLKAMITLSKEVSDFQQEHTGQQAPSAEPDADKIDDDIPF